MSQPSTLTNRLTSIRSKQPWLVMQSAGKFSLCESVNPDISHYYGFQARDSSEAIFAIPDGCIDILFDCDGSQPSAEVFGTPISALEIELKGGHRYFGVRFASGLMPDCMNASAEEMIASHYSFQDLVRESNQLLESTVASTRFSEQVALVESFFEKERTRKSSPLTTRVTQLIVKSKGGIRINELEDSTGYSSRTIERQFRADMGMTPKAFCRIVRCQSAIYDINHSDEVRFSDLACDLGFSDQSHFLREFKKQVNTTPKAYLKRVKHQSYLDRIEQIRPLVEH